MKIRTTRNFVKPRQRVHHRFRSLDHVEAALLSKGLQVERIAGWPEPAWNCTASWRNTPYAFAMTMAETVQGEAFRLIIDSKHIGGTIDFTINEREEGSSVDAVADLLPRTLTSRVTLQALSLASSTAEERLKGLVAAIVRG